MQIHDTIDAIVAVLQCDKALDRAKIIPEMEVAGGLDTGKNPGLETGHRLINPCGGAE